MAAPWAPASSLLLQTKHPEGRAQLWLPEYTSLSHMPHAQCLAGTQQALHNGRWLHGQLCRWTAGVCVAGSGAGKDTF